MKWHLFYILLYIDGGRLDLDPTAMDSSRALASAMAAMLAMATLLDVDGETAPAGTAASLVAGGDERVNVDPTATDSLRAVASAMAALLDIDGETLACDDIPAPAGTASNLIAGGDECDLYLALSFTPDFF